MRKISAKEFVINYMLNHPDNNSKNIFDEMYTIIELTNKTKIGKGYTE